MNIIAFIIRKSVLYLLLLWGFFGGIINAQNSVEGIVLNTSGYPITGVRVVSGDEATITDEKGVFIVKESETIYIKSPGYISQVFYPPFKQIVAVLEEDQLFQKVDVAYARKNRSGITSSVSRINSDELRDIYETNLGNTLYGRISGLTVIPLSGEPGNDHPSYMIRGVGSLNNAEPLVFVDGIEMPLDLLNSEEIESISVLKDAAALAPFGIQGANGVIWVTTKRGTAGKPVFRTSIRSGLRQAARLPEFVDAYDYARLYNEARSNDNGNVWTPQYSSEQLNAYQTGNVGNNPNHDLLYPDINWYDEVLRTNAPSTNADFSMSGGDPSVRYFLFMGYQFTEGLYKDTDPKRNINSNNDYQKVNVRANVDLDLPSIFDASFVFGGVIEDRYTPSTTAATLWNNMARYPANAFPVETPEGWGGTSIHPNNPKATVIQQGYRQYHNRMVQTALTLGQDLGFITEGLRLTETYSLSNYQGSYYFKYRDYQRFQPYLLNDNEIGYNVIGSEQTDFTISQTGTARNTHSIRQNLRIALNYDRIFNHHHLQGLFMFINDEFLTEGNNPVFTTRGFSGRLAHSMNNKYFTEFGYAFNGTGDFPSGNNMGFFPAISFAWLASNEEFLENHPLVDYLKFRISTGLVGNNNIGGERFAYQQYYRQGNTIPRFGWPGTATSSTLFEYQIANPLLTWEKSHKTNFGIDARLMKKLDVGIDLFYERRFDILVMQNTLSAYGYLLGMTNEGEVTNRGVELDFTWSDNVGPLSYFINPMFSYARNRIEKMNEAPRAEDYLVRTGYSINQPFALESIGLFHSWEEINNPATPIHTFDNIQPGDIRYVDQNGDGIIDENDLIALNGHYPDIPEITYSISMGVDYKGFDLQIFGYGVTNRSVYLRGLNHWAFQNQGNAPLWALERWAYYPDQGIDTRSTATYPRLSIGSNNNNFRNSSFWIRNGSYFRLAELTLGYTLPRSFTTRASIYKARVFFTGTNLFTQDHVNTVDPHVMTGHALMKSFNFGLNVNF